MRTITLFLLLCLLTACEKKPEASNLSDLTLPVKTASVTEGIYYPSSQMIAQAKPLKSVNLVARVSGFLEQRNFIEGSYVKQGTLLYLIEQKPYEIALKKSRSSLGIAQARAENARLNFMRVSELYREKVAPPQKFDSARASKQEGDAELLGGEAQLAQAELNLSYTKITAPFNGWIGLSAYDVGNYISAPSRPLAQLMYIDSMRIEFNVSDSYLTPEMRSRLQDGKAPGLRVTLLEEDGSVYPHEGKITFWNNTINRQTATLQVQALFPNPKRKLVTGMFVRIAVGPAEPRSGLLLPETAVMSDQAGEYVYVVGPDRRVSRRDLKTGYRDGGFLVVNSGLQAGEQVIVEGIQKVRPGALADPKVDEETLRRLPATREAAFGIAAGEKPVPETDKNAPVKQPAADGGVRT